MALSMLSFMYVIIIVISGGFSGSETHNFPLDDCSTEEMDILFLLVNTRDLTEVAYQKLMSRQFVQDLKSFSSNKTTSRVLFAEVFDGFSAINPHVNVSSWCLHTSPGADPYGLHDQQARRQQYKNVKDAIVLKIAFVQHLFSEMGGVRENVTHIAVIFLDGAGLSFEESRSVPHIVQQQGTGVRIFVVVVSNKIDKDVIYLRDTLLVYTKFYLYSRHGLTLAICNQCMDGWFKFEHNDTTRSLSCYKLFSSNVPINWNEAWDECYYHGAQLAAIETKTELNFLHKEMSLYFKEIRNHNNTFNQSFQTMAYVYIGLHRNFGSTAKRFKWQMSNQLTFRPLVVNYWIPSKPSGGRSKICGVWQFIWSSDSNDSMSDDYSNDTDSIRDDYSNARGSLRNKNDFVDGWMDLKCDTRLRSLRLCEMAIPRRIEANNLIQIKPAMNDSFRRALAKGDFTTFGDNIVSPSANVASTDFLNFLQQSGNLFPLFDCRVGDYNPQYISYLYVCDNIDHCSNRRDETFCILKTQVTKTEVKEYTPICSGINCCDGSCLPLQWVNDGEIDCFVCGYGSEKEVNDESEDLINFLKINETCVFICNGDLCVTFSQLRYVRSNCFGAERHLYETIEELEKSDTCYNTLGRSIWAPKCVYVKSTYGAVLGCRDMSHLEDCTEFECPEGYFKCPNTYCIPQHYVHDGQADCPIGEEEQTDIIGTCTGNFACWDSKMCLHPHLVCDGYPDCPYGDDEVDCRVLCPEGLRCVSGTLTRIMGYNKLIPLKTMYPIDTRIRYVDLSGTDLSGVSISPIASLKNAVVMILSNCKINNTITQYFFDLERIRDLDLSYNLIRVLDGSYVNYPPLQNVRHLNLSYNKELTVVKYLQMTFLETLDLSHTGLSDIDESLLVGLLNLKHLNLSCTFVTGFQKNIFSSGLVLQTLDLRGLPIDGFYLNSFNGLTISQHLFTDRFELCCPQIRGVNIPYYTCHAPDDVISSCFNLVGVRLQRVLLWLVAVIAVMGNITVIVYRVIWDRSVLKTGYGLFVTNLGISDFIMGVYLFIIAGADYYYRGIYILYDKTWRESIVCKLAGFLATLSCETSTFFVFLITLDRFLVMKFPFGQIKFSKMYKFIALLLSWIIGFLLALTPIVFQFGIYSSNAMCLGLPLTTKQLKGWEYTFCVFIVLNLFMCLIITYGQRAIFIAMSGNRMNVAESSTSPRRTEDIMVAKQLSLVALSNLLCRFPVGVMGLFFLGEHQISDDVYAWTTVIILPINSAANPLLYTIPALTTKWEKFKSGGRWLRSRSQ